MSSKGGGGGYGRGSGRPNFRRGASSKRPPARSGEAIPARSSPKFTPRYLEAKHRIRDNDDDPEDLLSSDFMTEVDTPKEEKRSASIQGCDSWIWRDVCPYFIWNHITHSAGIPGETDKCKQFEELLLFLFL